MIPRVLISWCALIAIFPLLSPGGQVEGSDREALSAEKGEAASIDGRAADFQTTIAPLLNKHCYRCHDATEAEAELRLDHLSADFSDSAAAETWHDVLNRLNLGEMPPEEEPQPTTEERSQLVDWLTGELRRAAEAKRLSGGRADLRRLTRYEYGNTLRDLLGIDLPFAEDLPPESVSEDGFKNSGAALGMSPLQMELYLQIAREALSKAIVEGPAPKVSTHRTRRNEEKRKKNQPAASNHLAPGDRFAARVMEFPREGEVVVRVRAGASVPDGAAVPRMRLTLGMRSDVLTAEEPFGAVDVTAPIDEPQIYEFRRRIEQFPLPGHNPKYPGIKVTVWHGDPVKGGKSRQNNKRGNRKRAKEDAPDEPSDVPTLQVDFVEFQGPVFETWPPPSHSRLLPPIEEGEGELDHARRVIRKFASRAFRRPAVESEVSLYASFFASTRDQWPSYETAIAETLAMVLVSPEFLYLMKSSDASDPVRSLNDYELATRLSYFLWSTMPDERLTREASAGSLRDADSLGKVVRRMIADPRSDEFVKHFSDQWLNLSGMERVAVNPEYYPDFDDALKSEFRGETHAFFAEILRENLSAINFIESDFAMLNRKVAQHYGISGPAGSGYERVRLSGADHRGGVLTQASVLLGQSNGEDSHPIRRSVWLLDRILGSPPPPPPPDVPELDSSAPEAAKLTVSEQLELHRSKDACNHCHRGIDPWGIAFENYDAVGRWRTDILRKGKRGREERSPVLADATLPGGEAVSGAAELKQHLIRKEKDRFARALVRKLLAYSLGRSLDFSDDETVEALCQEFASSDYRFGDLMIALTQSEAFQSR